MTLDGKVIACAGGGSGIGRAAIDAFLAAGARVGVLEKDGRKADALAGLEGLEVVTGDAAEPAAAARLVDATVGRFHRLDVLCTFVGVFDHYRHLEEIPGDALSGAFAEMFTANVLSALVLVRSALPHLRQHRGAVILTLSSSSFYPGRGGTLYVASKHALRGVVVQLAHELAPEVRVNGVAPGGTLGTDLRGLDALDQGEMALGDSEERRQQLQARTPLRVALGPADHAGAYVFLASDAARSMTGEILRTDGGLSAR